MSENDFDKALISDEEWSKVQISRLSSRPNAKTAYGSGGYDANAMKAAFDAQGNMLKERHNLLTDYARAEESARAKAETARDTAETARDTAETVRNAAEDARVIAEIGAVGNWYDEYEGCVRDADGNIVPNENAGRVGADLKREYHSLQARAYEMLREQSEEKRQAKEGERQAKELERQADEGERQAKEDERERNETIRITNEEVRGKKMAIFEMLIGEIGSVADAILEKQESYIGGDG